MEKTENAQKILFLSSWFPNRTTPVNGDFVERHALAVARVCRTAVLHVAADPRLRGRFIEIFEIQKDGLFEVIIYFRKARTGFSSPDRLINTILYAAGYLIGYFIVKNELGKPDVIHANIIAPVSKAALWLSRISGAPFIISEHFTAYLSDNPDRIPTGFQKPVNKAFALVPVTRDLRDSLIRFGYRTRYEVVPNVVDTEIFRPGPPVTGTTKFLHVSSMKEEHKNISGILRSVRKLLDSRNDFVFTFVGEATPHQKELAKDLGLDATVTFTGELPHKKVASAMQQCHFLVMFSNVENLPCVILEALACGLPVLSTNTGGIPEWINAENGLLVEVGDEDALTLGMSYLMDHLEAFDRSALHKFATEHFSPHVIAGQFLTIYNQALKSSKK